MYGYALTEKISAFVAQRAKGGRVVTPAQVATRFGLDVSDARVMMNTLKENGVLKKVANSTGYTISNTVAHDLRDRPSYAYVANF